MKKDYLFVGLQLALFVLYTREWPFTRFLLPTPFRIGGDVVAVLGILMAAYASISMRGSLTAFPSPKHGGQLITTGIFRFSRHPIYTGLILFTFGYAISDGSYWKLIVCITLVVLFYFKSSYEEQLLEQKFPDYGAYKKKVGRFFINF